MQKQPKSTIDKTKLKSDQADSGKAKKSAKLNERTAKALDEQKTTSRYQKQ
ncbi:MAG: hypothetical protein H7Y31_17620 [Chitinophagaceae bacterium]|nr:hypothetical protein [Chitinophagaceae bacterium]